MRFAPCSDAEEGAKGIRHNGSMEKSRCIPMEKFLEKPLYLAGFVP
jgi:hypothetical protein